MVRCLILAVLIFQVACKEKRHPRSVEEIPYDSLLAISKSWQTDSLGCLHLRDPRKIIRLIEQAKLIGKDSILVKEYLGNPNGVAFLKDQKYYVYWLECVGDKKISYSNFYCYFRGDTLYSYRHSVY